jgi:hypothetical protein
LTKSTFLYVGLRGEELEKFKEVFPYKFADLSEAFKYLGYYLKEGMYKAGDWRWLLAKLKIKLIIDVIDGCLWEVVLFY